MKMSLSAVKVVIFHAKLPPLVTYTEADYKHNSKQMLVICCQFKVTTDLTSSGVFLYLAAEAILLIVDALIVDAYRR